MEATVTGPLGGTDLRRQLSLRLSGGEPAPSAEHAD